MSQEAPHAASREVLQGVVQKGRFEEEEGQESHWQKKTIIPDKATF